MVEFRLLGPLEVEVDGRRLSLGSAKQRALLAYLVLRAGETVSRDALVDALWGAEPPATAAHGLDVYVSRLRKSLAGGGSLVTRPGGYVLEVDGGEIDVLRFERGLEAARAALGRGKPAEALALLDGALGLWRGRALLDLLDAPFARVESDRLDELKVAAREERVDALLGLGRHDDAIAELHQLVAQEPLRERLRRQLMLALYRAGRQADALDAYREARATFVDELGLEPSPALRELERQILDHDPALAAPSPSVEEPARTPPAQEPRSAVTAGPRRRRLLAVPLLAIAAAAAAAGVLLSRGGGSDLAQLAPESAGLVDAKGRLVLDVVAGSRPQGAAVGFGSTWVANAGDDTVSRIDPEREAVVETIPVGSEPVAVATAAGSVWVVNDGDGTVSRVAPATNRVVQTIKVGNAPNAIAAAPGALWVANALDGSITRIDPTTGRPVRVVSVGVRPTALAVFGSSLWVTNALSDEAIRVDSASAAPVGAVRVGNAPGAIATVGGSVWVANTPDGTISRIDPARAAVAQTIGLGTRVGALASAGGYLWAAEPDAGRVVGLDPRTGAVVRTVAVWSSPSGLAPVGGKLWVTTQAPPAAHRGGTLRIERMEPLDAFDPALLTDPGTALPTNDGLVAYDARGGFAQGTLVPDLALALPQVSDGGRTYTFQLRRGLSYSDGEPVRASDVRFAIERLYRLRPQPSPYVSTNVLTGGGAAFLDLVGERACMARPRTCDLSRGVTTDDRTGTIAFHLVRADTNFVERLTYPAYDLLPPRAPLTTNGLKPLPATGPYVVASVTKTRIVATRNPRFRVWSTAAQPAGFPDRIVLTANVPPARELSDVLAGRADWMQDDPPAAAVSRLQAQDAGQLHFDPAPFTFFLFLNTRVPPFDDLDARRAVNYAIDRGLVQRLLYTPVSVRTTCQILSPNFSGYVPYCPYTLHPNSSGVWQAPDTQKARELAAASGTRGTRVVLWMPSDRPFGVRLGRYVSHLFDSLGWPTTVRYKPINFLHGTGYFQYVGDSRNRAQAGWASWTPDFTSPADYVDAILGCDSFVPRSPDNANAAEFCDPAIQRQIDRAKTLDAADPASGTELWTRIEHELVDRAPIVPLANPLILTLVSRRVGDYVPTATAVTAYDLWWVR